MLTIHLLEKKYLPGKNVRHIKSTHICAKYIPYPVYLLLACSTSALPTESEIPVDPPDRLQRGSLRVVTPLQCFFDKVIKGFKSACKYLEKLIYFFLRRKI